MPIGQVYISIMHKLYRILCIKILCDDKIVPPVVHLLHSVVQMCTVRSWSLLSPSHSIPREVAQLDATIGAVCGEYSSLHLSKPVGKVLLRTLGRDKVQARQNFIIFSESTVLDF